MHLSFFLSCSLLKMRREQDHHSLLKGIFFFLSQIENMTGSVPLKKSRRMRGGGRWGMDAAFVMM